MKSNFNTCRWLKKQYKGCAVLVAFNGRLTETQQIKDRKKRIKQVLLELQIGFNCN